MTPSFCDFALVRGQSLWDKTLGLVGAALCFQEGSMNLVSHELGVACCVVEHLSGSF